MWNPDAVSQGSIMPRYPWMFSLEGNDATLDLSLTKAKLEAMQTLGVPYSDAYVENWEAEVSAQAAMIAEDLNKSEDIDVGPEEEIVALIAYLQRLGTDVKKSAEVAEK